MISAKTASSIRRRIAAYEKAREQFDPIRYKRGGGYSKADERAIESICKCRRPTNEQTGQLEFYDFMVKKPRQLFVYVKEPRGGDVSVNGWSELPYSRGHVTLGAPYRVMGTERQSIRFTGLNGITYAGTYFSGSGTYARVKAVKSR